MIDPTRRQRAIGFLLAAVGASLGAPLAPAATTAELAARVPADAAAYAEWAGADSLSDVYAGSTLSKVVDASKFSQTVPALVDDLLTRFGPRVPGLAQNVPLILRDARYAWHHPLVAYFGGLNRPNLKDAGPAAGIIMDAGADADAVAPLLADIVKNAPPENAAAVTRDGTIFTVTFNDRSPAGGFAATPAYHALQTFAADPTGDKTALAFYVDTAQFHHLLEFAPANREDPADRAQFERVLKTLDIERLGHFYYRAAFASDAWDGQSLLEMKQPAPPLLAFMTAGTVGDDALKKVPIDATACGAMHLDIAGFWDAVRDLIVQSDRAGAAQATQRLAMNFAQIKAHTGVDIEAQVFRAIGDTPVFYQTEAQAIVVLVPLKDPEGFKSALAALEPLISAPMARNNPSMAIHITERNGLTIHSIIVGMRAMVWTVANGHLIFTTSPRQIDGIAQALAPDALSAAKSILDNPDFATARDAVLPAGAKPIRLAYTDSRKTVPQMLLGLNMALGMANMAGANVSPDIIPQADALQPYLAPAVTAVWVDAQGIHTHERTRFPGESMLAGDLTIPAVAFGTAVMIPSLGRARELANRAADGASLTGIAKAANLYGAENNDALPPHMAVLLINGWVSPKGLVSRSSNTKPLELTPQQLDAAKTDWKTIAPLVDAHTDFIYVGAGMHNDVDATIPLVFSRIGLPGRDGINIAFQDAHVEFVRLPMVQMELDTLNAKRHDLHLPDVTMKDLQQPATEPTP
jgi:hypothetical protein